MSNSGISGLKTITGDIKGWAYRIAFNAATISRMDDSIGPFLGLIINNILLTILVVGDSFISPLRCANTLLASRIRGKTDESSDLDSHKNTFSVGPPAVKDRIIPKGPFYWRQLTFKVLGCIAKIPKQLTTHSNCFEEFSKCGQYSLR